MLLGVCFKVMLLLGMGVSRRAVATGILGQRSLIGVLLWVKFLVGLLCCVCWHAGGLGLAAQHTCTGQALSAVRCNALPMQDRVMVRLALHDVWANPR